MSNTPEKDEGQEMVATYRAFINSRPDLISFLYDVESIFYPNRSERDRLLGSWKWSAFCG